MFFGSGDLKMGLYMKHKVAWNAETLKYELDKIKRSQISLMYQTRNNLFLRNDTTQWDKLPHPSQQHLTAVLNIAQFYDARQSQDEYEISLRVQQNKLAAQIVMQ